MLTYLFTPFPIFSLFTIIHLCTCEEFQDLILGDTYTTWKTKGNLTATLFRVVLNTEHPPPAIRVSVTSKNSSLKNPLTVTVIRGKTVHNIALSRVQAHQGKRFEYWLATDTLCDDDRSIEQLGQTVYLSIASSIPSVFRLLVKPVSNFNIGQEPFEVIASPSEPRYYMYTFPEDVEKVDIRATSESEICARVIVRHTICPLFDGSGLLELSDDYYFQTFTKFAGFSIRKSDIGPQFHLAVSVNPDNSMCGPPSNLTAENENPDRIKTAWVSVSPVSEKTILLLLPIVVYVVSMTIVLLLTYFKYKWLDCHENNEPNIFDGTDSEANVIVDKIWLFDKPTMIVSHKEYQKQRLVKDSKYFNFLFFQIFGSVLPALTTLFQNKQHSSDKTNLDLCYLNYLCSLDCSFNIFHFNSFNSVTSVSSFAVIGILNLIIVFRKKIFRYQVPRFPTTHGIQQRDAPKVVCLLGLVAMGILGIISNNCPDKTILHLFIYTLLWFNFSALMWIYSKRHGVRRWQPFYIIAVSSIFGCIVLVENMFKMDEFSTIIMKIAVLHISAFCTGYLCYKYYYERPSGLQEHQWIKSPFRNKSEQILCDENGIYQPLKSKIFYVIAAMTYSVYCPLCMFLYSNYNVTRLVLDMGKYHVGIYFFYYTIQKIRFEWSSFTLRYKIIVITLTIMFLFFETFASQRIAHRPTFSLALTPAKSRELNVECVLPGIDWHNLLHYTSAFNCFIFIVLMDFIDSNIKGVPKKNIFVF